ncbi:hypothetical protein NQD34_004192 [Periophthalmus magnuspinnatus]|nr:hypothetical protein NQD34_004192 [Periophthalmus magnuspinnatus]
MSVFCLQYMGQANLHVFDEWCGSSVDSLRKNVHYPLHPHVRTTVKKLAVAPQQHQYGLRIFGYIHPPADGDYVFALSSDDNSELWLSTDNSPLNLLLRAWVGKTGAEWTAPGEYDKYINQKSVPISLFSQMKYFFEVIYKQDTGNDHVAVAWRLPNHTQDFEIIQSDHISLYVDESPKLIGDIAHIPQTAASHEQRHGKKRSILPDMQREDPRDTLYRVPLVNLSLVSGLLPDCEYNPSYTLKGQRLGRYEGLNYVHLSYIYPNDHTRLTHLDEIYPSGKNQGRKVLSVNNNFDTNNEDPVKSKGRKIVMKKSKTKSKHKIALDRNQLGAETRVLNPLQHVDSRRVMKLTKMAKAPEAEVQNIYPSDFGDISPDQWDELGEPVVQSMPINENSNAADKWSQTFQVKRIDYQGQKSHALNMDCRVTGNIQAQQAEVQSVVGAYLDKITQRHGRWTLAHVANVVLNVDVQRGRRYLVELVVRDETGTLHRLSQYIYAQRTPDQDPESPKLCYPTGFNWNPQATVHFVIPVKNQAKWVHLLIKDMETLVKETGDANFNLILTDFNSSDMDVEQGLAKSQIPRYQYKKLTGNFERSRGLQEGVNLIKDPHSIVFLFDLHIRFPSHIIDLLRKHCVEGYQAFAPIVMRLECGASPLDAIGYWEVQGFGLLGIYKSDLEKVGGMNTREFKDRWGGEDWELLDRVLMGGLEVERLYIRNLYHHFHSKRGMWVTSHH